MSGNNEEILQLEKSRTDAILAKDVAALTKLFDDELVYIHSSGRLDTKTSYIDNMKSGKSNYKSFDYANVKVRRYGDCAIVSGDVVIEAGSHLDLRFTNVWSRSSGQWRNVHWSSVKRAA
mgnify:CR=1 FL=1